MISADQALQIVLENVAPLGVERIPILDALGRVLAENISSSRDIPGFDNSAMDGYAVRAGDVAKASETSPVKLAVVETVGAGQMPTRRLNAGQAVRTMTGAPIADGADAIIPVERTRGTGEHRRISCSGGEGRVHPAARRGFARWGIGDVRGQTADARRPRDARVGESRDGRSDSPPARRDRCHWRRAGGRRSAADRRAGRQFQRLRAGRCGSRSGRRAYDSQSRAR